MLLYKVEEHLSLTLTAVLKCLAAIWAVVLDTIATCVLLLNSFGRIVDIQHWNMAVCEEWIVVPLVIRTVALSLVVEAPARATMDLGLLPYHR